jgi:hypothetical protein
VKIYITILSLLTIFLFFSCLSTQDKTFASVEEIGKTKIIGIVETEFRIYDDVETFESVKGIVYRKLLSKATTEYKYLNIDIGNITIEGSFSLLNILTIPINGYITPFVMIINAKGFVILKE